MHLIYRIGQSRGEFPTTLYTSAVHLGVLIGASQREILLSQVSAQGYQNLTHFFLST